jgi:sortase A
VPETLAVAVPVRAGTESSAPEVGAPPVTVDRPSAVSPTLLAGRVLLAAGLAVALVIAFELFATGLLEGRAQAGLLTTFQQGITTTALDLSSAVPAEGSPIALLRIPHIGVSEVVIEGSSPNDLKSGPGHLSGTPLPGEFGNSVIIGHRTIYGGPFSQLNLLAKGDSIDVTTGQGYFSYTIRSLSRVNPGGVDPITGTSDSRLTLVTSDSPLTSGGQLVVVAGLSGRPMAVAARPPTFPDTQELGLSGDPLGLGLGLIWAELLAAAIWLALRLRRRWPPGVLYMLAAPVVLTLVVLTFTSFDMLLPGTL